MINVIGGGPAGSYASLLLAEKGFDVTVYEDHEVIGVPIQCTGITTTFLERLVNIDEVLINETQRILVHSPQDSVEFSVKNLIFDRDRFDQLLAKNAQAAGVQYRFNCRYTDHHLVFDKKKNVSHKLDGPIVGADGPRSKVAECVGMKGERSFLYGVQGVVKRKCDADVFEVWLGSMAPGLFAWSVPENKTISRVGVACPKSSSIYFDSFLKRMGVEKKDIQCMQGGLIPIYNPALQTKKENTYIIGDAATHVKATTGGGIIPGMLAAQSLVKDIDGKKDYEWGWKKSIGRELRMHLLIRTMLDKFSDNDYDQLIGMVKREKVRSIIQHHDREFPIALAFDLLIHEPRFLTFAKHLF